MGDLSHWVARSLFWWLRMLRKSIQRGQAPIYKYLLSLANAPMTEVSKKGQTQACVVHKPTQMHTSWEMWLTGRANGMQNS